MMILSIVKTHNGVIVLPKYLLQIIDIVEDLT